MDVFKHLAKGAIALIVATTLAACAVNGAPAIDTQEDLALEELKAEASALGSSDQVRITTFGEPELSGEFVVGPNGTIAFPLLGEIKATDLTVEQFSRALEEGLKQGYLRQPRVTIEVLNFRPFFILGEVDQPGTYPYSSGLTVMNAVATAGGFTYRADSRRVYIKRGGSNNEEEYRLTSTTPVRPGDTVRIAERRF